MSLRQVLTIYYSVFIFNLDLSLNVVHWDSWKNISLLMKDFWHRGLTTANLPCFWESSHPYWTSSTLDAGEEKKLLVLTDLLSTGAKSVEARKDLPYFCFRNRVGPTACYRNQILSNFFLWFFLINWTFVKYAVLPIYHWMYTRIVLQYENTLLRQSNAMQ